MSNFTVFGNKITRGNIPGIRHFYPAVSGFARLYDNGYTACYYNSTAKLIETFCEGDVATIECKSEDAFQAELARHRTYFEENEM